MTKLLDEAIEAASRLPDEQQDYIARAMFGLLNLQGEPRPIPPEDFRRDYGRAGAS